jgi:hypothetical protein
MKNLEQQMQIRLFTELRNAALMIDDLALVYASANGGKRNKRTAELLKAQGVKAGIPDIHFPVAKCGYNSLYIELKIPGNKETDVQRSWRLSLALSGNLSLVIFTFEDAFKAIIDYQQGNNRAISKYEWMRTFEGRIGISDYKKFM